MLRMGRESFEGRIALRRAVFAVVGLVCATLADTVVGPAFFAGWTGFRFLPAFVVFFGMFRGSWSGLWAGWLGGLLAASLSTEPLGFALLRLGLVGFAAGFFRNIAAFGAIWVDGVVLMLLLLMEDLTSGLVGWSIWGAAPDLNIFGILATGVAGAAMLRTYVRWRGGRRMMRDAGFS